MVLVVVDLVELCDDEVVVCTVDDTVVVCATVVEVVITAIGVPVANTSVCASLSLEVKLITYLAPGTIV